MEKKDDLNREKALEDLAYIKHLTIKSRQYASEASAYFILWGIIWVIGYGGIAIGFQEYAHWIWGILSVIGLPINFYIAAHQEKSSPMPRFLSKQFSMIWLCFLVIAGIFVVLISTGLLAFEYYYIGLYALFLVAIMYALLGVVLGKEIFLMGIWLGVLGTVTIIWFMPYSSLIFSIVGGGSMIATGIILKRWRHEHE